MLSLDIGTSSVRAALYDSRGEPMPEAAAQRSQHVQTTADGGAEMRAEEVVQRTLQCAAEALHRAGAAANRVAAVAVCTYWHSVLGVSRAGKAITPIYLWSDTRSTLEVEALRQCLDAEALHRRTGCPLHTSYVAPKLLWLSRVQPQRLKEARQWVSIGEYLFLRLFGEPRCSYSMASGTGMFDLARRQWDPELLSLLPITPDQLTKPAGMEAAPRGLRPEFAERLPQLREVPWYPALGDGACSNVGSGGIGPDRAAVMIGTSGAMRALFPAGRPEPPEGLWSYLLDDTRFLLGGALSNGGNLYTWLVNALKAGRRDRVEKDVARMPPDSHGLTVLPFLMGERSPGWRGGARGVIAGLSAHTRPIDIVRAGLEAVAYRFALIHERLAPRLPANGRPIIATGGALLHSPAWMQILADVLNRPLVVSREQQASERGAALVALEALGILPSLSAAAFPFAETYRPDPERHALYQEGLARHRDLYERMIGM